MILSLLTDPRVSDEDYNFHNNYLQDINTGDNYIETYRRRITDPLKQILMGIQQDNRQHQNNKDKQQENTDNPRSINRTKPKTIGPRYSN